MVGAASDTASAPGAPSATVAAPGAPSATVAAPGAAWATVAAPGAVPARAAVPRAPLPGPRGVLALPGLTRRAVLASRSAAAASCSSVGRDTSRARIAPVSVILIPATPPVSPNFPALAPFPDPH
jgi:hypothetical protein